MSVAHNQKLFSKEKNWLTGLWYAVVVVVIIAAWLVRDRQLVVASEGTGYLLGLIGSVMMVLLLLYPLRKRAKWLRKAGPVKHWFRIHMILGIAGPLLVLLHSNFNLGSTNSQIALFCTVVVSSSGIIGRYLYAKVHYGLYGQRATFDSVRKDIDNSRSGSSALHAILPTINDELTPLEDALNQSRVSLSGAVSQATSLTLKLFLLRLKLRKKLRQQINELSESSPVVQGNRKRLVRSSFNYLDYRFSVLRKFAQLQAFEKLFSLWHVVHYPLFMVLVVAAIVHVVAVHMY